MTTRSCMSPMFLAVVSLFLCLPGAFAASQIDPAGSISAPVLAFSSSSKHQQQTSPAQALEVHDNLNTLLQQLLQPQSSDAHSQLHQHKPGVFLTVLGSQLRTSHLKSRVLQPSLQPLKDLLSGALSSLTVPYVLHQGDSRDSHVSHLQQLADGMDLTTHVVGCSSGSDLDAVLSKEVQGPRMIVLCTQPPAAAAAGSAEAVAAELQEVQAAHAKVAQLGREQLTIYAAVPDEASSAASRRQLLGVGADVGTCGQLCQTQVKWLEGILAAFILAIAAFSGMCCLYMLDTPTRFEKPKEGARND